VKDTTSFRIAVSLLFGIPLLIAAGVAARAQGGAAPSQEQPPRFRTEANFIRVDAYPTHNGQPVLDLTAQEFEIQEDGKLQTIQSFEHITVAAAGTGTHRSEPNTIDASRQAVANPRNRVFVLFLDTPHVSLESSLHVREPLLRLIDRMMGPDDLIGVMTPRMSASDVVLARKMEVVADGLRSISPWGERFTLERDERETSYEMCYPGRHQRDVIAEMTARKRERSTLNALNELVRYLGGLRDERKGIITISEGWLLYQPNPGLTRLRVDLGRSEPAPLPEPISVGPDGTLTTKNPDNALNGSNKQQCDIDREYLSEIDDQRFFRDILGDANRANATFYTVDPRGLPVFDTQMSDGPVPPVHVELGILGARLDSLRVLAENTDGIAVLNHNNLDANLKRIANDLSSYYLIGYRSTNPRLDGKFHTIKVRVKRPGVDVRARRGYRAATEEEVAAARSAAAAPVPDAVAAVNTAMASLSRLRPDTRFSMNAVPISGAGTSAVFTIWIAGELPAGTAAGGWSQGGTAMLDISAGTVSTTARVTLAAGERTFAVPVKLPTSVEAGALDVRATLEGTDGERFSDILRLDLASSIGQPMLFRRGLTTGNRLLPAASFQFSRTERARLEFPATADSKTATGRLLDRTGEPLAVPVTIGERTDTTGQHWVTADITLAPLSAGDYAVELTRESGGTQQKIVTAIRITR
jgi:VWFA-related protein